jgi:fucose permease
MNEEGKKRMTWLFMLIAFAVIVGYDIAAYQWFPVATISALTDGFAEKYVGAAMGVCLAIGYLLGHLFWPQYRSK